jgi:uncharacterized protein (DUF58 family)
VPGVYVSLADLVGLQWKARGFGFKPKQPVHSLLAGRRASRMRGRGLDFEEIRGYLPGDDIRTMDWKVTARTGKPQVRVYTEERDRPLTLVVDQRPSMFFGTRRAMKSVAAAEVAALAAWRAFAQGDRVGGWVIGAGGAVEVRPHRSRRNVLTLFQRIIEANHALEARPVPGSAARLNETLDAVQARALHDHAVLIISDFDGADDRTRQSLIELAQHNDVIAVPVLDPTATSLPASGRIVVSNRELQFEIDTSDGATRQRLEAAGNARLNALLAWDREIGVPVLPVSNAEEPAAQVRRLIGRRQRRGAR